MSDNFYGISGNKSIDRPLRRSGGARSGHPLLPVILFIISCR